MTIITQIQGGLGNQLFQYAVGRALSHASGENLILDDRWYGPQEEGVTPRSLLLGKLRIQGQIQTYPGVLAAPKRLGRILQKCLPLNPYVLKERRGYIFQQGLDRIRNYAKQDLYLMGYWQSFRYFESIREALLVEITPQQPLDSHYQRYRELIASIPNATMVHIRRGDYVHLPAAAQVHGALDLSYYRKAMALLLQEKSDTHFFVFSDDIAWAKANLPMPERLTFIENLPDEEAVVQELELMRSCEHHIIANSSLSWWGAWLGDRAGQLVFCPPRWIADSSLPLGDLLPAKWRRLSGE